MKPIEIIMALIIAFALGMFVGSTLASNKKQEIQPAIECINGEIYDVTYEGNLTIKDKRFDVICEETK